MKNPLKLIADAIKAIGKQGIEEGSAHQANPVVTYHMEKNDDKSTTIRSTSTSR